MAITWAIAVQEEFRGVISTVAKVIERYCATRVSDANRICAPHTELIQGGASFVNVAQRELPFDWGLGMMLAPERDRYGCQTDSHQGTDDEQGREDGGAEVHDMRTLLEGVRLILLLVDWESSQGLGLQIRPSIEQGDYTDTHNDWFARLLAWSSKAAQTFDGNHRQPNGRYLRHCDAALCMTAGIPAKIWSLRISER
jgi:hypothetical protein